MTPCVRATETKTGLPSTIELREEIACQLPKLVLRTLGACRTRTFAKRKRRVPLHADCREAPLVLTTAGSRRTVQKNEQIFIQARHMEHQNS